VDEMLKALGDGTRRRVLDALRERDGQTLTELHTRLDASRQAVAHHLDVLEAVGLVTVRRHGRYRVHYLDTAPLRTITERWPPSRHRAPTGGLRTALDLTELGAKLRAQRHRREHPWATDEEVRQVVDAWLMDHTRAPYGDGEGRSVPWPRPT
jgi:DNA-binding transcriptional ArsR family regulator